MLYSNLYKRPSKWLIIRQKHAAIRESIDFRIDIVGTNGVNYESIEFRK